MFRQVPVALSALSLVCPALACLRSLVRGAVADCFGKFGGGYFLAACEFGVGLCKPAHRVGVSHDGQRLFQPLQVLDGDQHGGRAAMDSDSHSLVVVMHAADELRQVGLYFSQRQRGHSQKFDQKVGGSQTADDAHRFRTRTLPLTQGARQWHVAGTKEVVSVPSTIPPDGRYGP